MRKTHVRCLEFWRRDHEKMWSLFLMRRKSHWGWSTQRLEGRQHHQKILIQTLLIGDTILFTPACKILDNAMADQKSDNLTSLGPCFTRYCQISPTATSWFLVGLSKVIKVIFKFPGKLDSCVSTTSDDPDDEDWAVTVSHRWVWSCSDHDYDGLDHNGDHSHIDNQDIDDKDDDHRCLVDEDQRSMTVVNDLLHLPNKIATKVASLSSLLL